MSRVVWIGAAALVALVAIWFFSEFERVPDKVWLPPSGEARLRPFLAAERLAERMGMRAKELRSMPELDALPASGVLILPAPRDLPEPARAKALLAWVERGGHLVVEAEPPARKDPLLDLLGLGRKAQAKPRPEPFVAELADGRRLAVAFTNGPLLSGQVRKPSLSVGDQDGWRMLAFPRGKGLVTVASSLDFARNTFVGQNDHAALLWTALSPSRELRVFARPHKLSLTGFLAEHAGPALAGGVLLLALWLWRIAPRFGPLLPDAPPARRRLLDHLRASGRYFWARGRQLRLLAAAREAALRRVARAQPDFALAPLHERAARLARLAGIGAEQAARFLAPPQALRGAAFIDMVRVAQQVHAALDKGRT